MQREPVEYDLTHWHVKEEICEEQLAQAFAIEHDIPFLDQLDESDEKDRLMENQD